MSLNYVTVTGSFEDGSGNPIPSSGQTAYCMFTPSQAVYASGIPLITPAQPIQAPIINGVLKGETGGSLTLLATDNAGVTFATPTGFFFWTVQIFIAGQVQQTFSFFLPHSPSTADLSQLASTAAGGGFQNPMTTLGDLIYENATPAAARLAGDTSNIRKFLRSQSVGGVAQAPVWDTIQPGDLASTTNEQGSVPLTLSPSGVMQWGLPWQFSVTAYGALGNGKVVTDGAITTGTATLTSATASFTSADTGKWFIVNGAGAVAGESLVATGTFVNATTMTLSVNAGQTVSGATTSYGTDDTAAFQAAVNAAVAYAQAHAFYAEVLVPPALAMFYMIAGMLQTGGTTHGNAQITLPVIATSAGKITLVIKGTQDAASLAHWQQQAPELSGANLVSTGVFANAAAQNTSINANGNPCIIGGPAQPAGYGTSGALFSNMAIKLDGIRLIVPMSQNGYAYCGFDFSGVAASPLGVGGCDSTATYQSEWSGHNMGAAGFNFGGLMSANGNNDRCPIEDWAVGGGFVYGMMLTEHCNSERMRILYCWTTLAVSGSYWSTTGVHAIHIGQLSGEGCTNALKIFGAGSGGVGPFIDIDQWDWEGASAFNLIDDNSGVGLADARGTIKITGFVPTAINVNGNPVSSANPTGLNVLFGSNAPGHWASAPAVPASGTAQVNTAFKNASIVLHTAAGVSVSAITIDGTVTGLTMAASSSLALPTLPPDKSIAITYAGGTPTWDWWLS